MVPLANPVPLAGALLRRVLVACIAAAIMLSTMAAPARAANWYSASTIGVPEANDQLHDAWGVAVAPDGTVYVAATGSHIIKKFAANGTPLGSFGGFGNEPGQLWAPRDVAVAADGSVYVSDTYNHRIQRFGPNGEPLGVFGRAGTGPLEFSQPLGISVAPDGTVYVADEGNSRIQRLSADGTFLGSWGSAGVGPGQFSGPTAIAVTADGSVYVGEHYGNRLQKFTPTGTHVWTVGSSGSALGQMSGPVNMDAAPDGSVVLIEVWGGRAQRFAADGTALATFGSGAPNALMGPRGVAVAPDGTVVVADTAANRIRRYDAAGALLATWGRPVDDPGQLVSPGSIARASDGTILVVEPGAQRVSRFAATGAFLGSFGSGGSGDGQFSWPRAIAIAPDGTLYVTDYWNHRVQRFAADGTFMSKFGSSGTALGLFANPTGIAVASDGTVIVADRANGRIQRFTPAGVAVDEFGAPGLATPNQVSVLADGSILVSEEGANRLQRFSPAGMSLALIGGPGTSVGQFSGPFGLGQLATGELVVADMWNRRIQRLTSAGAAGSAYTSARDLGLPSGVAPDPDGSIWVSDTANNRIAHLVWDADPPRVGVSSSAGDGTVTFTATASDPASGLAPIAYSWDRGATWTTNSSHTVSGLAFASQAEVQLVVRDRADNHAAVTAGGVSLPDRTPPQVSPPDRTAPQVDLLTPIVGPLSRSGRLRFRLFDDSGVVVARSATFRGREVVMSGDEVIFRSAVEGSGTLRVSAQDAAGNVQTWSTELTLDFTPPAIAPGRTLRGVVGRSGLIALTIGAGESYPVSRSATFRGRAVPMRGDSVDLRRVADGRGLLRVTAHDAAGNSRTWHRRLLLDRRAPTIGNSRVTRVLGAVAALPTFDRGSGVVHRATAVAPRLGRNIASATAVDRAGNRARRTVVLERHLSLASPNLNADLRGAGSVARHEHVVDVFSFVGPYAPWYASRDESPPLVREVQWRLQQFGYLSPVLHRTGRLDLPTIRAVQRYQAARGLPVLGTVGPRTRRLLDAEFRSRLARSKT